MATRTVIFNLLVLASLLQVDRTIATRTRRGFGESLYGQDIFGSQSHQTLDELNKNQNIALWSAQSAVTSSVGQIYGDQQANLALAVLQFVTLPKKSKHTSLQSHRLNTPKDFPSHQSRESHNEMTTFKHNGSQRSHKPSKRPNTSTKNDWIPSSRNRLIRPPSRQNHIKSLNRSS